MFSIRATTLTVAAALSVASLGACKKDRAASADSVAAAMPITPDTTPKALEVGDIDMGRHIGPDQKITDKTDDFNPKDTIYAAVVTKNAGTGKLTARWVAEDGKTLEEKTTTITPTGDTSTAFFAIAPTKLGKYTVHILLNDAEVKTKDIEVKKK